MQRPVVWLRFASFQYKSQPLREAIWQGVLLEAERLGIELDDKPESNPLSSLLRKTHQKYNRKVVLLIDEYDKPIIDYLDGTEVAERNRDILKWLYSVLKDSDPYLELVFITGVSAFSKVSIFSDLNNLYNLSLSPLAKNLNGITQEEI